MEGQAYDAIRNGCESLSGRWPAIAVCWNRRRAHHPVMADAPDDGGEQSSNHPDGLHHVLFEDGHVKRVGVKDLHGDDHLFRNHDGKVAAGVDDEDAVIGDSHHQP